MPNNTIIIYGRRIPSQNSLHGWHWKKKHQDRCIWLNYIKAAAGGMYTPVKEKRAVHIISYRNRLIMDHSNLVGGAKGLVDAIVKVGLLYDDSDEWAHITYTQQQCPKKEERTEITIDGWNPVTPPQVIGHPSR